MHSRIGREQDESDKRRGKVENLIEGKVALKLDKYEYGMIFHFLNEKRNEMIKCNAPTDAVDDMLLKLIEIREDNQKGRKCHEAR